jgi:hypothetical protein
MAVINLGRTGLNNDDVKILIREYRTARNGGAGPDEAWSIAKRAVQGVDPAVLDAWRPHIHEKAEGEPAPTNAQHGNLVDRVAFLESENADLKRKLADAGTRNEELSKQLAAAEELLQKPAAAEPEPVKEEKHSKKK